MICKSWTLKVRSTKNTLFIILAMNFLLIIHRVKALNASGQIHRQDCSFVGKTLRPTEVEIKG